MLTDLRQRLHTIKNDETSVEHAYGHRVRNRARGQGGHSGARFYCPICDYWYRKFYPFGLRGRPNAKCPGCGSLERHRFLWLYLAYQTKVLRQRGEILHVAPEACIQSALITRPGIRYLGIDRYDDDAAAKQHDLTDLTFPTASFDLIICNHVLEHIPDDRKALAEISRVLRPGGRALIMVPIDRNRQTTYEDEQITTPSERHEAFGHPYHVRVCGWDYGDRIRECGFTVFEAHSSEMAPHKRRMNRINKTVLFDCAPDAP
jgi:SAM-dependent methyltransferase